MVEAGTKNFTFADINFGSILTSLINIDTITDIELRCGEVWLVDIKRGRYKYNLGKHSTEEIEELNILLSKLPMQISIRMQTSYNEGSPILDGESIYKDKGQLRISAIHNALTGEQFPGIAIRKTTYNLRLKSEDIRKERYATDDFLKLMKVLIASGCNVMITGITGSGKTELLKYLARFILKTEAIITIEDTFEAYLKRIYPEKEVLALKSNEHQGFSELIRACLRQNPDWIIVSETRGVEVIDLMEAVGTGHHLISTVHSDSALNIPWRMVDMAKLDGAEATRMFRQVHQNINIGIYIHYYNDERGSHRQITEVCEFFLDDSGRPVQHMIYEFDYALQCYKSDIILSKTILNKVNRSRENIDELDGIFFNQKKPYKYKDTIRELEGRIADGFTYKKASELLDIVLEAVNAEAGSFWIAANDGYIYPAAVTGGSSLSGMRLGDGEGIAGGVIKSGTSRIIEDCQSDPAWNSTLDKTLGFTTRSMICVPVKINGNTAGCFEIINRRGKAMFDSEDLFLAERLSLVISRMDIGGVQ